MSKRGSIFGLLATRKDNNTSGDDAAPPPAYNAGISQVGAEQAQAQQPTPGAQDAGEINVTAAFEKLNLSNLPSNPSIDTCLAHLKLLLAIQNMKEDVGFTDGLWDLWDARAGPDSQFLSFLSSPSTEKKDIPEPNIQERMQSQTLAALSKIREKRWALFVAQAVDRYEVWWKSLTVSLKARPLTEDDMRLPSSPSYRVFTSGPSARLCWSEETLPPLGTAAPFFLASLGLTIRCRCPHGMAHPHVEPPSFPRGCHLSWDESVLAHRDSVESC